MSLQGTHDIRNCSGIDISVPWLSIGDKEDFVHA